MHSEDYFEVLAKELGVTPGGLRSSDFWREIGGEDLDAIEQVLREESEASDEDLT
jgi:hypothetical protein